MRMFPKPNLSGDWICPICKTNEEKSVTLIPIDNTEEGNNIQALQVHVDCINLRYYSEVQRLIGEDSFDIDKKV